MYMECGVEEEAHCHKSVKKKTTPRTMAKDLNKSSKKGNLENH
jgi:hypothetical protein